MLVGQTRERKLVSAEQLKAPGPMAVLLKDAMMPNLVQTLENNPAFIHGGPFGNIAHGCNSVMATRLALKLCDYVVTEAGFGADLGGEKFFDIKCRKAGLNPELAVVVATIRALKMHGGVAKEGLGEENLEAVRTGLANLGRHLTNVRKFGVPAVVAINEFATDTAAEHELVRDYCRDEFGIEAIVCSHWADGSAGTAALAEQVVAMLEGPRTGEGFRCLYPDDMPLWDKVRTIATEIYGAADISAEKRVRDQFKEFQDGGFGHFPICVAKTQYSFSTDPNLKGAPSGHVLPIREIRLSGGAEFLVVICGEIMTMPGLPRVPAAHSIRLDEDGLIEGLF
jgi:formate--tetrahydrofolate ligase